MQSVRLRYGGPRCSGGRRSRQALSSPHAGVRSSALSGRISPVEQRLIQQLLQSRRSSSAPDADSQRGGTALHHPAPAPQHIISRRNLLLGGLLIAASPIGPATAAESQVLAGSSAPPGARWPLHSKPSAERCLLTVANRSGVRVRALWVNYDGDEEAYSTLAPGQQWAVQTFESHPWRFREASSGRLMAQYSHPWRFREASSGRLMAQYVAQPGEALLTLTGEAQAAAEGDAGEAAGHEGGFDGLGHPEGDFVPASLSVMAVLPGLQQVAVGLSADGYDKPILIGVGPSEALNIVRAGGLAQLPNRIPGGAAAEGGVFGGGAAGEGGAAAGGVGPGGALTPFDGRGAVAALEQVEGGRGRPTLFSTWVSSVQALGGRLERVVFTRQVDDITYARIVLALPSAASTPTPNSGPGRPTSGAGPWSSPGPPPPPPQAQAQAQAQARPREGAGPWSSPPPPPPPPAPSAPAGRAMLPFAPKSSAMPSAVDPAAISAAAAVGTAATVTVVSVDARPADALALAIQAGAPVFVAKPLAEKAQADWAAAEEIFKELLLSPPGMGMGGADGEWEAGGGEGGQQGWGWKDVLGGWGTAESA
ncbi:hypothetical protein HYH03_012537 [Edaphochlamys debaryana]|uniref:BFN domain-containing protein n=1 Tax=Edaphochlamys debaryana TaxID=47281 RepID=A0A836BVC6_9CHLO|nr:hypothetical protein HYH03_012537 [Edaphochlamys debaryana]|eukprot:KAG2488908.1 hypothetical protein HYH03_012537 [Edaphochlamys debaryana]